MINFLVWGILGGILGWATHIIVRPNAEPGVFMNILMGSVGAFLAGMFLSPLFGVTTIYPNRFSFPALLVSVIGAVILLASANVFRRGVIR